MLQRFQGIRAVIWVQLVMRMLRSITSICGFGTARRGLIMARLRRLLGQRVLQERPGQLVQRERHLQLPGRREPQGLLEPQGQRDIPDQLVILGRPERRERHQLLPALLERRDRLEQLGQLGGRGQLLQLQDLQGRPDGPAQLAQV